MSIAAISRRFKAAGHAVGVPIRCSTGIVIPPGIVDLESFRRWARSDDLPEKARVAFFQNQLWMDPTMEQAYTHNRVKGTTNAVLLPLGEEIGEGHYFTDGMLLTNSEIGFTTIPDGLYVSFAALESGRVVEVPGKDNGCVEFVGSPDMVLEIMSRYTAQKDEDFITLYFRAGIPEYWLIDVRREPIRFDIFRRNARKYIATRKQPGGWLKSPTFGRSFRLASSTDRRGRAIYRLEVKAA